jgi:hypothetical protein
MFKNRTVIFFSHLKIFACCQTHKNIRRFFINFRFPLLFVLVGFFIVTTGCSHSLRITNLNEYYTLSTTPPKKETVKLGVTSSSATDIQGSRYVDAILDGLRRNSSVEKVIYPYNQAIHQGMVDLTMDITIIPYYSGSGSNFLVNWPGFLIFAPAIWGYGYNAEIDTKVNVIRVKDNLSHQINIPTKWKFRQAEIDRTWTEIGWFEVSLIPFIGGIVFTQYDTDVTDEFITKVAPNYGTYVAKKILEGM